MRGSAALGAGLGMGIGFLTGSLVGPYVPDYDYYYTSADKGNSAELVQMGATVLGALIGAAIGGGDQCPAPKQVGTSGVHLGSVGGFP